MKGKKELRKQIDPLVEKEEWIKTKEFCRNSLKNYYISIRKRQTPTKIWQKKKRLNKHITKKGCTNAQSSYEKMFNI